MNNRADNGKKMEQEKIDKVLQLVELGKTKNDIARIVDISIRSVFNIMSRHKKEKAKKKYQKEKKITIADIIDIRLLYYCDDIELLQNMYNANKKWYEIHHKGKKIEVPARIEKLGLSEKIEKIMNGFN